MEKKYHNQRKILFIILFIIILVLSVFYFALVINDYRLGREDTTAEYHTHHVDYEASTNVVRRISQRILGSRRNNPSWDIHITNLREPITTGLAVSETNPTISHTQLSNFHVSLTLPNDSVSYTFDIKNNGNMDARISTIFRQNAHCTGTGSNRIIDEGIVCQNIRYDLRYYDNTPVREGDIIRAGQTKTIKLVVAYIGTELPEQQVKITNLGIALIFQGR